jgi:CRP-like cAMP-binding protein
MNTTPDPTGGNRLLATLSPDALQRLEPEAMQAPTGKQLLEPDVHSGNVFFPHTGTMVSIMRTSVEGTTVEVGIVGSEGALPLHSVLATLPVRSEAVVQINGSMTLIGAERVREAFMAEETFRNAVLVYVSVYLDQVSQNAICNRLHSIEQRLAKWLLSTSDHTETDKLELKQDFIAHMLGVRRPGVTIAVNALSVDGLIEHGRGMIMIADRNGLQARACECYRVLSEGWQALTATA